MIGSCYPVPHDSLHCINHGNLYHSTMATYTIQLGLRSVPSLSPAVAVTTAAIAPFYLHSHESQYLHEFLVGAKREAHSLHAAGDRARSLLVQPFRGVGHGPEDVVQTHLLLPHLPGNSNSNSNNTKCRPKASGLLLNRALSRSDLSRQLVRGDIQQQ